MELKVWVEGIQRIVCGVTDKTTCQVGQTFFTYKVRIQIPDIRYTFIGMSPVSPVFYTVVAVSIGLKNVLRMITSIL